MSAGGLDSPPFEVQRADPACGKGATSRLGESNPARGQNRSLNKARPRYPPGASPQTPRFGALVPGLVGLGGACMARSPGSDWGGQGIRPGPTLQTSSSPFGRDGVRASQLARWFEREVSTE